MASAPAVAASFKRASKENVRKAAPGEPRLRNRQSLYIASAAHAFSLVDYAGTSADGGAEAHGLLFRRTHA